ncbi:MAG TPA: family 1 glycosylhydrolase [Propionicimonas sp.]
MRGYLAWSSMDNFEWAPGDDKRSGALRVDENLRRIPRASALWQAASPTPAPSTAPIPAAGRA